VNWFVIFYLIFLFISFFILLLPLTGASTLFAAALALRVEFAANRRRCFVR
jgi:hypothetical protein